MSEILNVIDVLLRWSGLGFLLGAVVSFFFWVLSDEGTEGEKKGFRLLITCIVLLFIWLASWATVGLQ